MWKFFSMWLAKVCPFMRNLWRLQLQLGLTLEVGNFLSLSLNFDLFCGRISLQLQLHHHIWVTSSPRYHLREKMDKFREREMERQMGKSFAGKFYEVITMHNVYLTQNSIQFNFRMYQIIRKPAKPYIFQLAKLNELLSYLKEIYTISVHFKKS